MNDFHQFRDKIRELVSRWKKEIKPGIEEQGQYGETNTRKYLIDPVLEALNWVDDGSKKTVDNEFAVKHKTGTGSADYALKVNGIPKILLEAKDVAKVKDLDNGYDTVHGIKRTYPRQLSNYCHDMNSMNFDIGFSILTNGKEWIVYNMQYADISSEREIVFRLDIDEMDSADNLQKLWSLELNQFIDGHRLRELIQQLHDIRFDIDKKAVQQLLECKDLLSTSILNDYEKDKRGIKKQIDKILQDKEKTNGMPTFKEIPEEERLNFFIKEASSSVINKILFIRILEDKNFLTPKLTKRSVEKWKDFMGYKDYEEIMKLFRDACGVTEKLYNGGLFKLNPYDKVEYDHNVIKKIIDILGEIKFREIDSDIIGRIYEIYLGQVLKVESEIRGKKRTKYQADNKERKKLGQYYTPKFVVDFIVKNTLGKLIEGKKPEEIAKIRILDPACGSGSFLINAYDKLVEYYENWNSAILKKIEENNKKNGASLDKYQNNGAIPNYKNIILKENIHGVDLNDLSVQIAEINLWIRALERDKKLIKLNKNILHGNSLVTGVEDEEELSKFKQELEEIEKRTEQIKDYYDKNELSNEETKRLETLELRLKVLKEKINLQLNENLKDYFDDHLNIVHPFNWEVEFSEVMQEGGFDVIIGNPPYFSLETIDEETKSYLGSQYSDIHAGKNDILYYFYKKGIKLLKKEGCMGYITSRYFIEATYGRKLRNYIKNNSTINYIINFGENIIFEGVGIHTCILILSRNENSIEIKNNKIKVVNVKIPTDTKSLMEHIKSNIDKEQYSDKLIEVFSVKQDNLKDESWVLTNKSSSSIRQKVETNSVNLDSLTIIEQGQKTGENTIFCIDSKTADRYKIEKNLLKKLIKNSDITRYHISYDGDSYLLYIEDNFSKDKFPNAFEYLSQFKSKLSKRAEVNEGAYEWFRLQRPRDIKLFLSKEKLIVPYRAVQNQFAYDTGEYYSEYLGLTDTYIIVNRPENSIELKVILGILNSHLMNYYYKSIGRAKGAVYEYVKDPLARIPIKNINFNNKNEKVLHDQIRKLVNQLIFFDKNFKLFNNYFYKSVSNQSIKDLKSCKFGHYFDNYELYNMERETSAKINQIKAKILSLDVKEEGDKFVIYMTNYNEEQDQLWEDIKAVKLTVKDEDLRKFLFFALKQYINKKGGRGFGKGNLLELIKNIEVPVYVQNVKMNIRKIKDVMKEFNHLTKELWFKDESKKEKFESLNELEAEIKKTDKEIDEMVYKLYGISEEEKKVIEESLN